VNIKIPSATNYSPSVVLHFLSLKLVTEMSEERENGVAVRSRNVNTATPYSCNRTQA